MTTSRTYAPRPLRFVVTRGHEEFATANGWTVDIGEAHAFTAAFLAEREAEDRRQDDVTDRIISVGQTRMLP